MTGDKQEKIHPGVPRPPVFNRGIVAGLVTIGVLLIIFIVLMTSGFFSSSASVPPQACGDQSVAYINSNIPPSTGGAAKLLSVRQQHDTYEITLLYNGRNTTVYASKDCALLFTKTYNLNLSAGTPIVPVQAAQTPVQPVAPLKSARPSVDLYVMSFCPYGVQAETAMKPVAGLLGTKADFKVHYIVTVKDSSVQGIQSLHGTEEAKEDLRQLCIMKYYPDKLWTYISGFNARCYPGSRDPAVLDQCWRNVSSSLAIDTEKVIACSNANDSITMIIDDERIEKEKHITGSPTLQINNQTYSGQRTPEAYKKAICDRFTSPPLECNTNLSDAQAGQASGSCG